MKYLSAYCMVALSGEKVSEGAVQKVLESVGCEVDAAALKRVFSAMEGKNLHEVIAAGMGKLAAVGSSSGAASAPVASSGAAPAEKKEEKKPEPEEEEEEDVDMGDLFGDF